MGLERKSAEQISVVDKYVNPIADYQMLIGDSVVRADASAGAMIITLPSVTEAKGLIFSIKADVATPVLTVTVVDKDDSEGWGGDYTFIVNGNSGLFYSDGRKWTVLFGGIGVLSMRTELTNDQIIHLRASPVTLVPSLGATKLIEFLSITLRLNYGGTNIFTETDANLVVNYTDGSGVVVSTVIECGGFIVQSADTITRGIPVLDAIVTDAASAGEPLVLFNDGAGEFGGNAEGDNTITVWTLFRVIETG